MNKLQQASKEYADKNANSYDEGRFIRRAFQEGAAYAAGAFAEWICKNRYTAYIGKWYGIGRAEGYTTAELYELWQQSI